MHSYWIAKYEAKQYVIMLPIYLWSMCSFADYWVGVVACHLDLSHVLSYITSLRQLFLVISVCEVFSGRCSLLQPWSFGFESNYWKKKNFSFINEEKNCSPFSNFMHAQLSQKLNEIHCYNSLVCLSQPSQFDFWDTLLSSLFDFWDTLLSSFSVDTCLCLSLCFINIIKALFLLSGVGSMCLCLKDLIKRAIP